MRKEVKHIPYSGISRSPETDWRIVYDTELAEGLSACKRAVVCFTFIDMSCSV